MPADSTGARVVVVVVIVVASDAVVEDLGGRVGDTVESTDLGAPWSVMLSAPHAASTMQRTTKRSAVRAVMQNRIMDDPPA
jgi:hypothetical protein